MILNLPKKKKKKHWRNLNVAILILFASVLALLISGCTNVPISDNEWCADAGSSGAICFNTLSDKHRDLNQARWDRERFGQVCTNTDSFTNWKTAIDILCQNHGSQCTYEQQKTIDKFYKKILAVKRKTK